MKTLISIITGFLGAGKTTLLKRIIDNLDRKFAILMNEFGDVSIDTDIIKGKNVNIAELLGGCVCCSLTGEFEEAIKEIIKKYKPEIIIVETTGVAEPDALVFEVSENLKDVKLDSIITVVDADSLVRFPSLGRTSIIQIEIADVLILNKVDLVKEKQLKTVIDKIRSYNKKAPILETKNCNVDIDLLFGLEIEHHIKKKHHEHDNKFEFFSHELKNKIKKDKFLGFVSNLPKEIYRLKGFVNFEDGCYLINYVRGRYDLEKKNGVNKLVFIGEGLSKIKEGIVKGLEKL